MKPIAMVLTALVLGACTVSGVTLDPNRSTASIAPDYLQLTPDEENIWAGMTDIQRERAILFINNGATLMSSLGSQ